MKQTHKQQTTNKHLKWINIQTNANINNKTEHTINQKLRTCICAESKFEQYDSKDDTNDVVNQTKGQHATNNKSNTQTTNDAILRTRNCAE